MEQTTREFDNNQERFIVNWLNKHYFSKHFNDVNIITDKETQIKGIDVILDGRKIDIKAMSSPRYLNNPANTFCFEISFINREGNLNVGWFCDDRLETEEYLLMWIPDCEHDNGKITKLNKVEIMFVDKKKLLNHILGDNNTVENLLNESENMRMDNIRSSDIDDDMHFSYSNQLREQPVNVIVSKKALKKCSNGHYIIRVTKNT